MLMFEATQDVTVNPQGHLFLNRFGPPAQTCRNIVVILYYWASIRLCMSSSKCLNTKTEDEPLIYVHEFLTEKLLVSFFLTLVKFKLVLNAGWLAALLKSCQFAKDF